MDTIHEILQHLLALGMCIFMLAHCALQLLILKMH